MSVGPEEDYEAYPVTIVVVRPRSMAQLQKREDQRSGFVSVVPMLRAVLPRIPKIVCRALIREVARLRRSMFGM
jgi:hypothetical protein